MPTIHGIPALFCSQVRVCAIRSVFFVTRFFICSIAPFAI